MDPQHYKILDMLKQYGHCIEIKYATNLSMLGKGSRNIYDYWPHFKSVALNVSIDGIGLSYEYIRGNADWEVLIKNIKEVQQIPNISRIVGAVAVQVSNVLILDKMIEYFLDDLGIVFYTNIVKYPNVLSVQCLPKDLKHIAIQRLKDIRLKIPEFKHVKDNLILLKLTQNQIDGIINYINAVDQSDRWADTVQFNTNLDTTRNQNFIEVTPEFKDYL
jgi:hypothetical protein